MYSDSNTSNDSPNSNNSNSSNNSSNAIISNSDSNRYVHISSINCNSNANTNPFFVEAFENLVLTVYHKVITSYTTTKQT